MVAPQTAHSGGDKHIAAAAAAAAAKAEAAAACGVLRVEAAAGAAVVALAVQVGERRLLHVARAFALEQQLYGGGVLLLALPLPQQHPRRLWPR